MNEKKRKTRPKGNANQVWIKKWLEERGWIVRNFPVHSQSIIIPGGQPLMKNGRMIFRRQGQDVFGADLLCRRGRGEIGRLLWIQSSGSSGVKKRADEFRKHFDFLLAGEHLQLWTKVDSTTWNIKEIPIVEGAEPIELGKIIRRKFYSACGWEF